MTRWVVGELGHDVPMHFTAFHPDFRMRDRPHTPHETLIQARRIALDNGVRYAYTGNVYDPAGSSTFCHACGQLLIRASVTTSVPGTWSAAQLLPSAVRPWQGSAKPNPAVGATGTAGTVTRVRVRRDRVQAGAIVY